MATDDIDVLRESYRPEQVRLLLVGESPPDPRGGQLRFFYSSELKVDNLYRAVATALYGGEPDFDVSAKRWMLGRMQRDGVWLIDAVDEPINALTNRERRARIEAAVPDLIAKCRELGPSVGVIICHGVVYAAAADPLLEADIRVLHSAPLPFPLGNWRARFIEGFRAALHGAHWTS